MLFNNDGQSGDRVLYKTKPNMILGCKKAIYGIIILVLILIISPAVIEFIGGMQVYLISYVKLSLTRYAAIAFFLLILIDVIYIIWQLVGWYSKEYILTDSKIIIKSGVLSTKKKLHALWNHSGLKYFSKHFCKNFQYWINKGIQCL